MLILRVETHVREGLQYTNYLHTLLEVRCHFLIALIELAPPFTFRGSQFELSDLHSECKYITVITSFVFIVQLSTSVRVTSFIQANGEF